MTLKCAAVFAISPVRVAMERGAVSLSPDGGGGPGIGDELEGGRILTTMSVRKRRGREKSQKKARIKKIAEN